MYTCVCITCSKYIDVHNFYIADMYVYIYNIIIYIIIHSYMSCAHRMLKGFSKQPLVPTGPRIASREARAS